MSVLRTQSILGKNRKNTVTDIGTEPPRTNFAITGIRIDRVDYCKNVQIPKTGIPVSKHPITNHS